MTVKILPMATNQSLREGEVGVGTVSITCPGILQCFAVVGQRGSALVGTHVTPGSQQEHIDATMDYLDGIGGDAVQQWYVLGPKNIHYTAAHVWKTDKALKTSFKNTFGKKGAKIMFLDATAERSTPVVDPRDGFTLTSPAIDIRASLWGIGLRFDYCFRYSPSRASTEWHDFDLGKFKAM